MIWGEGGPIYSGAPYSAGHHVGGVILGSRVQGLGFIGGGRHHARGRAALVMAGI